MKTKIILFVSLLFLTTNCYAGRQPLIDSDLKKIDLEFNKKLDKCSELKSIPKSFGCMEDVSAEQKLISKDMRGTILFSETHYLSLPTEELEKLFVKLKSQTETARRYYVDVVSGKKEPGEVTVGMLETELSVIAGELIKRREKKHNDFFRK